MGPLIMILALATAVGWGWAADVTIHDGDTLRSGDLTCRLDGIDAPELDQPCINEKGAEWKCGIEARDRLMAWIGKRAVRCDDKGPDPVYPKIRHICICWIEGETISLNQWLVREGLALNFEPYAKGRFKANEADAQGNRRGLWKGCFTAPRDFRRWNKSTAELLGPTCPNPDAKKARNILFPENPAMPPGCPIKGKFAIRAKITGHLGIYHMEGCRSYQRLKRPDRWFCSEDDAKAAGFRKAFNC